MRVVAAVVLGVLLGWHTQWVAPALDAVLSSFTGVLSSGVHGALTCFLTDERAVTVAVALVGALGVPMMLAALAEAARGGKSPRRAATLLLLVSAVAGMLTGNGGPYLLWALAVAALLAAAPGLWAVLPLSVVFCAMATRWCLDGFHQATWVGPSARILADSAGGSPAIWAAALALSCLIPVVATLKLLVTHAPRAGRG